MGIDVWGFQVVEEEGDGMMWLGCKGLGFGMVPPKLTGGACQLPSKRVKLPTFGSYN